MSLLHRARSAELVAEIRSSAQPLPRAATSTRSSPRVGDARQVVLPLLDVSRARQEPRSLSLSALVAALGQAPESKVSAATG